MGINFFMFNCTRCGEEVQDIEFEHYCDSLSSIDEDTFRDSGMCPECFEAVK